MLGSQITDKPNDISVRVNEAMTQSPNTSANVFHSCSLSNEDRQCVKKKQIMISTKTSECPKHKERLLLSSYNCPHITVLI